ncbi:MAG: hypothetical protein QOE74_1943 [Mycobacterium sp.]|nr:hypothetical protein [Mycobacterium sp.]
MVLAETAALVAALGWLYAAIFGVIRPNELTTHIVSWIPLRRDTFGILCFGLSATAYLSRGLLAPDRAVPTVVLRTLFGYSTVIVVYLMMGTVTHPETLAMSLTHLVDWPTERFTLWLAVVCSVSSFVLIRAATYRSKHGAEQDEAGPA